MATEGGGSTKGQPTGGASDEAEEEAEEEYGYDKPIPVAYLQWLGFLPRERRVSKAEFRGWAGHGRRRPGEGPPNRDAGRSEGERPAGEGGARWDGGEVGDLRRQRRGDRGGGLAGADRDCPRTASSAGRSATRPTSREAQRTTMPAAWYSRGVLRACCRATSAARPSSAIRSWS